jgi:hypothetical protein
VKDLTLTRGGDAARRTVHRAEREAQRIAQRERAWLVPAGRVGYAANGAVYMIVGFLALQAAIGAGGATTDPAGAVGHIIEAPFGTLAVGIVAVGLAGYAMWRLLQAVLDTEHKGESFLGLAQRIGFAIAGLSYAGLSLSALAMAAGRGSQPDHEQATQDSTAWLLSQPFGPWSVVAVALIVIGVAVAQFVLAYRGSFARELREGDMSRSERQLVDLAGRLGYAARGVAFGLICAFLVLAGWQARPDQARGLGGALASLASQPAGPWLLGIVAIGLIAYGVHMLISARYRQMVLG